MTKEELAAALALKFQYAQLDEGSPFVNNNYRNFNGENALTGETDEVTFYRAVCFQTITDQTGTYYVDCMRYLPNGGVTPEWSFVTDISSILDLPVGP